MNLKLLPWTLLLLCDPLTVVDADKEKILETQVIRHQVKIPPQFLSYMAASVTNDSVSEGAQGALYAGETTLLL